MYYLIYSILLVPLLLQPGRVAPTLSKGDEAAALRYLNRCEAQRGAIIDKLEAQYDQARQMPSGTYALKKARRERLRSLRLRIKELENGGEVPDLPLQLATASPGDVGVLRKPDITLMQRVGQEEGIVIHHSVSRVLGRVINTGSGQHQMYKNVDREKLFWLSGVSLKNKIDGGGLELEGLFIVREPRTYQTGLGPRTLPRIEPFRIEPYLKESK